MKVKELEADMVKLVKELKFKTLVPPPVMGAIALNSSLIANSDYNDEEKELILGIINMNQIEDLIYSQSINN